MYSATYRTASDPTTYYATLPTFHGMESENPYAHIKEFEDVCNTFQERGASIELMRLKLFPFTLKDKAKRYMEAINACPHHGFDTWLLVSYFYDGMSSLMKQLLEKMCGGDFMSKNPEEAMDFLSYVAELWQEDWRSEEDTRSAGHFRSISVSYVVPFVNLLRTWWRSVLRCQLNHLNFSWKPRAPQYTQPGQAPPLTNLNTVSEKGKFPSQPHQNPKGIHEVEAQEGKSSQVREVKAMITLRSGKEVDLPTSKLEHEPDSEVEKEKMGEIKGKRKWNSTKEDLEATMNEEPKRTINQEEMIKKHMPPPFPQALHGKKGIRNALEILECKSPVKCKDPDCPTISVMIRETCVEKALLDLGANRSVKIPRGMIEDALVQVDKFYYPVDFVVLDIDPVAKGTNCIPIILGRPFLATSNVIINCRNGVMQLTFDNMMLELNIFYMCNKQFHPKEEEGPKEVCMIDNLVEEHCNQKMLEDLKASLGDLDEGLPEPLDLLATLPPLKMRKEILPLFNRNET
ncbi:hypothetical protein CK203_056795 [Vitis vinifera]|uniref:Retrotransposon gag domain-containing protein n=1 Tax=Vitis vinifera TaxID=29760 RepID=A0A438FVE2_VITVI|nr:hypothetical protein CK203_056795 [Vitis vinifera]